jgi:hypothetical protein
MALLQHPPTVVLVVDEVEVLVRDVEVDVLVRDVEVEVEVDTTEVLVRDVEVEEDVDVDVVPPDGVAQALGAGESLRLRTPSTFLTSRPPNSAQ